MKPVTRSAAGFTLIELLVVIGILGLLAVALLPNVLGAQQDANVFADMTNLKRIHEWHVQLKNRRQHNLPKEGGHKFVLAPWVKGVCEHTETNLDRFFTPGTEQEDVHWGELKERLANGEKILSTYDELTSQDTAYAGRAARHYRGMWSGKQALASNDNEFGPAFDGNAINVLMGDGSVKTLYRKEKPLVDVWNEDDPEFYVTVGPNSELEILQKLER